jgi:RepB DNA-primase from phage plasmid
MARKIFMWIRWYAAKIAKRHLEHIARVRSQIANPCWEKLGSVPEAYFLAQVPKRTKPLTNRYWELMTYVENRTEAEKVRVYLEMRLQRAVNAYVHYDEGGVHAHFVARNANDQGRALRLSLKDIGEIKRSVACIVGLQLAPKGSGRRHIPLPLLRAHPGALRAAKQDFEVTVGQVQRVIDLYRGYKAVSVVAGRLDVQVLDLTVPVRDQLLLKKLKGLNRRGAAIRFAPVLTDLARPSVLFLDAVPEGQLQELPQDTLIVEVSEHRYQVHIPFATPITPEEVTIAQRMLSGRFESDRSSIDVGHYRRLPGFGNEEYPEAPAVHIRDDVKPTGPAVSITELETELVEQIAQQRQAAAEFDSRAAPRRWLDFFAKAASRDRNVADQAYASYLHSCGYMPSEIRLALLAESEDLYIRKKGFVDAYLDRTIRKGTAFAPTRSRDAGTTMPGEGLGRDWS